MSQTWSASTYAENGRFVADLGAPLLTLLAPQLGEYILDLGCGDGVLTEKIAASGAGVLGVDFSKELLASAIGRGVDARWMDGQHLSFHDEFDAVFSNAALHWMKHSEAVIQGVHRALRPGGRFVGEFGAHGNVAAVYTALHAVFAQHQVDIVPHLLFFPTPQEYQTSLEENGFRVEWIASIPRPTPLLTGMGAWLDTFARGMFALLPEGERAPAREETLHLLRPILCDTQGNWTADYVRLRFLARRG